MKAIIFDFDGVIHDTFEFHRSKIEEFADIELSEQDFKDIHNGNFFRNIPKKIKNINWEEYRNYIYSQQSNLKIKNKTRNIILKLGQDYELYIVSSGGTRNILDYMENNQMKSVFKEILGLETHKSKIDKFKYIFDKHDLNPNDCIFITDTLGDILEAKKVSLKTIAVDFGFHDRKTLEKGIPYKIISHLNKLPELI